MFSCKKKNFYEVRVDIEQRTTTLVYTSQSAEFPTSVGRFQEITTNSLNTLTQLLAKKNSVCAFASVYCIKPQKTFMLYLMFPY